jgi:hypothetical protein
MAGWADEEWMKLSDAEKASFFHTLTRERTGDDVPEEEFRGRFEKVTVGFIPDRGWRAVYADLDAEPGAVYTEPVVGWLVQKEIRVEGKPDPKQVELDAEHRLFVPGCMSEGEIIEPSAGNFLGLLEPGGDEKEFVEYAKQVHLGLRMTA